MTRFTLSVMLAVGAMLAASKAANAGENVQSKAGATGGRTDTTTMTLGGRGTAAAATTAAGETELVWYHGYRRGYYAGYYAGYYGGWSPYYGGGFYPYGYPYLDGYYPGIGIGYYGPRFGVGIRINGANDDLSAPAVTLNLANTGNQGTASRYDGGPSAPVPLPKQDTSASNGQTTPTVPSNTGLPVSLNKNATKAAKPYVYKAYGEK